MFHLAHIVSLIVLTMAWQGFTTAATAIIREQFKPLLIRQLVQFCLELVEFGYFRLIGHGTEVVAHLNPNAIGFIRFFGHRFIVCRTGRGRI